ncbi:MAG: ATP-binding protein [Pseudomonadota bacterium]
MAEPADVKTDESDDRSGPVGLNWRIRLALITIFAVAAAVIWTTNQLLTQRFTETTKNRAEVRLALYSGNVTSELQESAIVPQLLARDPALIGALNSGDYSQSSQRLISYQEEIGAAELLLMDRDGRVVAATDRALIGTDNRQQNYVVAAFRSNETVFTQARHESGAVEFYYARKIETGGAVAGVIAVRVDLRQFEDRWQGTSDAVMIVDSAGEIILATEPRWRGLTEEEALALRSPISAIRRAIEVTIDWTALPVESLLTGTAVLRSETRIAFQGWRMVSYTTYASVRERVNGVLALEIMAFAIILATAFYVLSRRALSRSMFFQRESADLRRLNERLQREVAERQKVEKTLEVAEQTLAQSSKLAALGEMSAGVSHELNQPLAAMKTYLAGAKLLLQRKRPDEALSSFQRIDDLIERMSAITRQLKSYARKGEDAFDIIDVRESVRAAVTLMEPQLRDHSARIQVDLPDLPVPINGDRLRLEQVIVNLLRNALDASRNKAYPMVNVLLASGETAVLTVRDNGPGIADLDALFEPFYTTKAPGEGVGLGLAISSGIVNDLGGRLTARNGQGGGAVFEVQLPLALGGQEAAE